jgi:hypothetical protein
MRRAAHAAVAGAACVIAISACGGGGSSGGKTVPKDNGLAAKSAQEILDAAKNAARQKATVHAAGTHVESGDTEALTMDLDSAHDAAGGFLTINGDRIDVRRVGTQIYVKASKSFLETQAGLNAAQSTLAADKWLKTTTSNTDFAAFIDFTSIDELLKPTGAVTKGTESVVNGQKVIGLVDSKGTADEGTLYISTTGDPLPASIVAGGSGSGTTTFTNWGASLNIVAPADAIDLSQLG